MSSSSRLDSLSSSLAESLRRASPRCRRQAALLACEAAIGASHLQGEQIHQCFVAIRQGSQEPLLREQLEALAAQFDEEYFRLSERTARVSDPEVLQAFSKARATSALCFALLGDGGLDEAVYEALMALKDPTAAMASVAKLLRPN